MYVIKKKEGNQMKINAKGRKETTIVSIPPGQVFRFSNNVYMRVYDADTDIQCDNCGEKVDLECYLAVDLEDGGLYTFYGRETIEIIDCEVYEK